MKEKKSKPMGMVWNRLSVVKGILLKVILAFVWVVITFYLIFEDYTLPNTLSRYENYKNTYAANVLASSQIRNVNYEKEVVNEYLTKFSSLQQIKSDALDPSEFTGYFGKVIKQVDSEQIKEFTLGTLNQDNLYKAITPADQVNPEGLDYNAIKISLEGKGSDIQKIMTDLEVFNYKYEYFKLKNKDTSSELEFIIDLR